MSKQVGQSLPCSKNRYGRTEGEEVLAEAIYSTWAEGAEEGHDGSSKVLISAWGTALKSRYFTRIPL